MANNLLISDLKKSLLKAKNIKEVKKYPIAKAIIYYNPLHYKIK